MDFLPAQAKYPKRIYFSDEIYAIKFLKGLKCFGETDPGKKEIRIKKGISRRATFITFIHELFHLIEFELPMRISHSDIYKFEAAVFELMVDNFL